MKKILMAVFLLTCLSGCFISDSVVFSHRDSSRFYGRLDHNDSPKMKSEYLVEDVYMTVKIEPGRNANVFPLFYSRNDDQSFSLKKIEVLGKNGIIKTFGEDQTLKLDKRAQYFDDGSREYQNIEPPLYRNSKIVYDKIPKETLESEYEEGRMKVILYYLDPETGAETSKEFIIERNVFKTWDLQV